MNHFTNTCFLFFSPQQLQNCLWVYPLSISCEEGCQFTNKILQLCQNYARWLPIYLADMNMNSLTAAHPRVYEEFMSGGHAVSRSSHPLAQVWTDMALGQLINADSKGKGGIVGISKTPRTLNGWFLTAHEPASIMSALEQIYGLQSNEQGVHKEAAMKRVK